MLNNGSFPWKNWSTGELVTETDFQNIHDSVSLNDKIPFWLKSYENYFWYRNTKDIHTMSAWSGAVGTTTVTLDTASALTNDLSIRSTVNGTAGNFWCGFYNDPWSTQNMLSLNSGETLTADEMFVSFSFYIDDITKWQGVRFRFGQDTSNFYLISFDVSELQNGWNLKVRRLSSAYTNNSPTGWTNIDYFYCYAIGINSNINGAFWIVDQITLIRPNVDDYPFSIQIGDGQTIGSEVWRDLATNMSYFTTLTNEYYANQEIGMIRPNSAITQRWLSLDNNNYKEFYTKCWMRCKSQGKSNSLIWYYDSLNYAQTYVDNSIFYLDVCVGGVTTTKTATLDTTLLKNWNFGIYFYKVQNTFIAEIQGEHVKPKVLTGYFAPTYEAKVYFGTPTIHGISFIRDWVISNKPTNLCRSNIIDII